VHGTGGLDVRSIGLGAPPAYEERRAAVAFQFPDQTLRIWYFHQTTHAPQEVGFTLNKTGEQVSLPLRLNCQAVGDKPVAEQFGFVFEQVAERYAVGHSGPSHRAGPNPSSCQQRRHMGFKCNTGMGRGPITGPRLLV
jgi:hypothetical protein